MRSRTRRPAPRAAPALNIAFPIDMIATVLHRSLRRGAAALCLVLAAPAFAQNALDDILAKKVLTVAIPTDSAPYGYVGTDLQPQGLDIDVANLIGAKLGVKVELVPVTSANRIPYLQTKKADLVISTLGKNPEREKVIDFTIAYAPFFSGVFGTKAIAVASAADLKGKTIGATRGAIEEQALTASAPPDATVKRFEDNNATIAAFVSGQVDLIATGNTVAAAIAEKALPVRRR